MLGLQLVRVEHSILVVNVSHQHIPEHSYCIRILHGHHLELPIQEVVIAVLLVPTEGNLECVFKTFFCAVPQAASPPHAVTLQHLDGGGACHHLFVLFHELGGVTG